MTCSHAMRRTGPLSAGVSWIWRDISGLSFSAARVTEMAFSTKEALPDRMARLFEEGSQVNTSAVSVSLYKERMNLTASTVFLELIVTAPASFCSAPPKPHSRERIAMLVSSSCDRPIPHGLPSLSLIALAPLCTSSQLSGPLGKPTWDQRSLR